MADLQADQFRKAVTIRYWLIGKMRTNTLASHVYGRNHCLHGNGEPSSPTTSQGRKQGVDVETRLAQIENLTLAGLLNYKPGDRRVDGKRGRKDGERDKPETTAQHYPFREMVITEAQAKLRAYHHKMEDLIAQHNKKVASLQRDLDERYASQRDTIKAARETELNEAENRWGPSSAKHGALERRFGEFSEQERHLKAALGRPLRINLKYWYAIIMAGVALVEIPINRFAFELYFSETPALSLLIALGVGVALMLLAHFGGTWLKRTVGAQTTGQLVIYIIGVLFIALLVFPTIFLIALLRQHYVHWVDEQRVTFGQLLDQQGVEGVARDVLTTELGTQGLMLLVINLLVVGIGIIAALMRHDAHPDYEHVVTTRQRLENRLLRLKEKYERASARINQTYEAQSTALDKQQESIEREIEETKKGRRKCLDHKNRMLDRVATHVKQRLQAYETANEDVRQSPRPEAFWNADEADIRKELEKAFGEQSDPTPSGPSGLRAIT